MSNVLQQVTIKAHEVYAMSVCIGKDPQRSHIHGIHIDHVARRLVATDGTVMAMITISEERFACDQSVTLTLAGGGKWPKPSRLEVRGHIDLIGDEWWLSYTNSKTLAVKRFKLLVNSKPYPTYTRVIPDFSGKSTPFVEIGLGLHVLSMIGVISERLLVGLDDKERIQLGEQWECKYLDNVSASLWTLKRAPRFEIVMLPYKLS